MLLLSNTLTRTKETFNAIREGIVNLYVCGITPYDYAHLGHGRCYVTFDILLALLRYKKYHVTYCRNFTDIDDKILNRAQKELGDKFRYLEISQKYIDAYQQDMAALNCADPDTQPRVTQTISEIIIFIQGLIEKGYAYEVEGDVYYRVKKFASYGKLSNRNLDDLMAGARVEINEKKEDPLDFALWKSEQLGTFWKSPWGYGRPGWHIECSAMAKKDLADHIDIHGGGMDLIFPHHENERAQSEGLLGPEFSKFWLHNAFVRIDQEKMSKSLNNFFTLRDVFAKFDPMVVRFYYLQHHYRSPLDFSFEGLTAAQKAYQKLCKAFDFVAFVDQTQGQIQEDPVFKKLIAMLSDDLNTVGALGIVFENIHNKESLQAIKWFMQHILRLTLKPLPEDVIEITAEMQKLIDQRKVARDNKDWATADKLRAQLLELGYEVQDKK